MDNATKFFQNSEIEYMTPFLKLWLSFNSWYKKEYRRDTSLRRDRDHIEKVKIDRNRFKTEFEYYLNSNDYSFFANIEKLLETLNNSQLKKEDGTFIYRYPDSENLILLKNIHGISPQAFGRLVSSYLKKSDLLYFKNDIPLIYSFILEIIYQIRCNLVHGNLNIENENNLEIVKYSYLILYKVLEGVFRD
jgi:hypothetical protein